MHYLEQRHCGDNDSRFNEVVMEQRLQINRFHGGHRSI
jgi:hypothetical protein